MAHGMDLLTEVLVTLEEPGESSPTATEGTPRASGTRQVSTRQRRLGLRQRLAAVTLDLHELWRDSLESGDVELVTSSAEASHAVHRAVLALEGGRIGAGPLPGATS